MKAVAIIALVVLVGVIEATRPRFGIPTHIKKRMEDAQKKKLQKQQPQPQPQEVPAPESSFFNFSLPKWNFSFPRFPSFNLTKKNHTWNSKGFRFEETPVTPAPTFVEKIKNHAKRLWAKRPWKKATPAPVPEASFFNLSNIRLPRFNFTHHIHHRIPTFNFTHLTPKFNFTHFRFVEETPAQVKPTFVQRMKNHAKNLWAKRPWKKTTPAPTPAPVTETSGFNFSGFHLPSFNFTHHIHHHIPTFNFTHHLPKFNFSHFRFEETAAAPSFFGKIKNYAKNLWAKRPWKKAPVVAAPESSLSFHMPSFNFTHSLPKWNITFPTFPTFNHTWNSKGFRFEETAAPVQAPTFVQRVKNHAKNLWAKRPWKKAPKTEESAYTTTTYSYPNTTNTWNSAGVTFPVPTNTWNSAGYTFPQQQNTWNSAGYRFDEETPATPAPTFVERVKNHAKKLWAKRPWKKAD